VKVEDSKTRMSNSPSTSSPRQVDRIGDPCALRIQTRPLSEQMERLMETVSRECNDIDHLSSNRTRLRRLWDRTRLPEEAFIGLVNEARVRTKARGNIAKPATSGIYPGLRNKAPYFFRVLESIIADLPSPPEPATIENQASTLSQANALVQRLPAFEVTVTITSEGAVLVAQAVDVPPGRYRAVLVLGNQG
jgi:hypothetical protein